MIPDPQQCLQRMSSYAAEYIGKALLGNENALTRNYSARNNSTGCPKANAANASYELEPAKQRLRILSQRRINSQNRVLTTPTLSGA